MRSVRLSDTRRPLGPLATVAARGRRLARAALPCAVLVIASFGATLSPGGGPAHAQTLKFEPAIVPATNGPRRGMRMSEVETRFGPPISRSGPVGDPPITTWRYDGFTVYFEHDMVLHATMRRMTGSGSGG